MQLIRTTLRIKEHLKDAIEKQALEDKKTVQDLFNSALEFYLQERAQRKAKKIIFKTHDLGIALNGLKRKDYYKSL